MTGFLFTYHTGDILSKGVQEEWNRADAFERMMYLSCVLQGYYLVARPWKRPYIPQPPHLRALMRLSAQAKQNGSAILSGVSGTVSRSLIDLPCIRAE